MLEEIIVSRKVPQRLHKGRYYMSCLQARHDKHQVFGMKRKPRHLLVNEITRTHKKEELPVYSMNNL